MSGRAEVWLFIAQRASAFVLAPLVIVHLATMIYAIQGGLSAEEILARTQGSGVWGAIYGLFVLAAAIHAPIGVRSIVREMTPWRGRSLDLAAVLFGVLIVVLGVKAVGALV
ncbi:MAG: succinate dehydrogenase [Thiotrichales bacterium]|nr:succinate dehydrogenase [Alphaproteobacteria bacterium]MBS38110.1 succinate dehydrogenase [Thiotrichales bacterium]